MYIYIYKVIVVQEISAINKILCFRLVGFLGCTGSWYFVNGCGCITKKKRNQKCPFCLRN